MPTTSDEERASSNEERASSKQLNALRIIGIYCGLGALWVLLSDILPMFMFRKTVVDLAMDSLFIAVTTFVFYCMITDSARSQALLEEKLRANEERYQAVVYEAGYTVLPAQDGEEALRMFNEHRGGIDLLIFDLIMPKMNGKVASDLIHKLQPAVKTIFSSGYGPDIALKKACLDDASSLIYKPVSPHEPLAGARSAR